MSLFDNINSLVSGDFGSMVGSSPSSVKTEENQTFQPNTIKAISSNLAETPSVTPIPSNVTSVKPTTTDNNLGNKLDNIGGMLNKFGAQVKSHPISGGTNFNASSVVPNFNGLMQPIQPMQPFQLQVGQAFSDYRSKKNIENAVTKLDKLLNTVYENVIKNRK